MQKSFKESITSVFATVAAIVGHLTVLVAVMLLLFNGLARADTLTDSKSAPAAATTPVAGHLAVR